LSSYLFIDRTLKWDEEFENKVMNLTAQQILDAMKKYIDPKKLSFVKAGDF
jgi:zinc protease